MDSSTDAIVEQVDQRNLWRRAEDGRRNLIIIGLCSVILGMGAAWGTASATVGQKVDRSEFVDHVSKSERRFMADSIRNLLTVEALRRIELKVDSTNDRLSRLICDNKPAYCR